MNGSLTAKALRGILIASIFILIALAGVGFYFAQDWIANAAKDVSQTVAKSNASGNNLQRLQELEDELAARQGILEKTSGLLSPIASYQSQAIEDLSVYAKASGIKITNYGFSTATEEAQTSANNKSAVTVSLVSPVKFSSLLHFMDLVESNIPKMQISTLNIGRLQESNGSVRVDLLTIDIYTR